MGSAIQALAFVDVTITNVAFPQLAADFRGTSISTLSWVVSGYGAAFAALLAPAGRLADAVGRRRILMFSLAAFVLTSAGAAAAPSVALLIAARVLQGAAAAAMVPTSIGIVLAAVSLERRTVALGVMAPAASLGAAAGPTLGGLLVEAFDWRAAFQPCARPCEDL